MRVSLHMTSVSFLSYLFLRVQGIKLILHRFMGTVDIQYDSVIQGQRGKACE